MQDFIISTDAADLPQEYMQEHNIETLSLYYTIDNETYGPGYPGKQTPQEFYQKMRDCFVPKTMQVNPEQAYSRFKPWLEQGKDILHIAMTSAASGSYNSVRLAAQELQEEFPERKIYVIDSLSGTASEALIVHKAQCLRAAGKAIEEVRQWVRDNIKHFCLYGIVDDLGHLQRGGRVSKLTSFLGTAMGMKPIFHLNDKGELVVCGKVRGRKQALCEIVNSMERCVGSFLSQNDTVFITHGDCIEDAKYVAQLIEEKFGIKRFIMNFVGPGIGSHSGPGAVVLGFLGEHR